MALFIFCQMGDDAAVLLDEVAGTEDGEAEVDRFIHLRHLLLPPLPD